MQLIKFRNQIIYILLFSKLAVILTTVTHFFQNKFVLFQVKELLVIILPLFVVYITFVLSNIKPVNKAHIENFELEKYIVLIIRWIPIVFALYMICVLTLQSAGTSGDGSGFLQMKGMIGWAEVIFGFYIGYIFQLLFQRNFKLTNINEQQTLMQTLQQFQNQLKIAPTAIIQDLNKVKLKKQLGRRKIKEVIDDITNSIYAKDGSNDLLNQVINLSSQYHQHKERKRVNLVKDDQVANQVIDGLLEIIDEL